MGCIPNLVSLWEVIIEVDYVLSQGMHFEPDSVLRDSKPARRLSDVVQGFTIVDSCRVFGLTAVTIRIGFVYLSWELAEMCTQ